MISGLYSMRSEVAISMAPTWMKLVSAVTNAPYAQRNTAAGSCGGGDLGCSAMLFAVSQWCVAITDECRHGEGVLVLIHSVATALVQASGDLPIASCS